MTNSAGSRLESAFRLEAMSFAEGYDVTYSSVPEGEAEFQGLIPKSDGLSLELRTDSSGGDLFFSARGRHLATLEVSDDDVAELRALLQAAAAGEVRLLCVSLIGRTIPVSIQFGRVTWATATPFLLGFWPIRKELRFPPWPIKG